MAPASPVHPAGGATKPYGVALAVIWSVPVTAFALLSTGVAGLSEKLLVAAWVGTVLGSFVALVLTFIVVPVIALSQWEDRRKRDR